jgi:predicted nucleic acid-binding protein
LRALDALIGATAVENNFMLVSGNHKHFKAIPELKFRQFRHN